MALPLLCSVLPSSAAARMRAVPTCFLSSSPTAHTPQVFPIMYRLINTKKVRQILIVTVNKKTLSFVKIFSQTCDVLSSRYGIHLVASSRKATGPHQEEASSSTRVVYMVWYMVW